MNLRELLCEGVVDSTSSVWGLVEMSGKHRFQRNVGNIKTYFATVRFSRKNGSCS
jgi:hypothetical protein